MLVSDSVVPIGDGFPAAFDGAVRYLTHVDPREIEWCLRHGKGFAGVHETAGLSLGYANGQREGAYARDRIHQLAAELGIAVPHGLIAWLGSFDADTFDVAGAQAYIDGANSELNPAAMLSGPYGSAGLGSRCSRWGAWWQCMSSGFWGNRLAWPAATLRQGFFNNSYDGNVVQQALWGNWFGAGVITPPSAPAFVGGGGQEEGAKVVIITRPGPGGRAVDAAKIGPEGNVWGTWGVDPEHLVNARWQDLGSPFGAHSVSGCWTMDGHQLALTCHGTDNQAWLKVWDGIFGAWLDGGQWKPTGTYMAPAA